MAKYAAYFRVSTENQGKSGLGLQAQQEAVQRFLKEDDSIAAEFTEVESGKRHQNRPQLAAALDYCRQRGCILLIATLDRLARNVHFISGLMETNVPFLAADIGQPRHHLKFIFLPRWPRRSAARFPSG